MATRSKTTRWAFATRLTDVATNTTLATATRFEFGLKTIYVPEATRTVKRAWLRYTLEDAFAAVTDYDAWRLGSSIGGGTWVDVDTTSNAANTGESEQLELTLDITANVVANMGAGTSFTLDAAIAIATGAISNVRNITCEFFLTYEYDDAASTHIKTVLIPLQSGETDLATTYAEVGSAGVGAAPANQIPQLTGAGSPFLPEASITIRDHYIIIHANESCAAAATAFNMFVRLDGATELTRATVDATLQTARDYQDIIDGSLMPSTTAAHAFEVRSSLADRFAQVGAVVVVTYEFAPGSSTTILNSVCVPARNARSQNPAGEADDADPVERLTVAIDVQEPATISFKQSGLVCAWALRGNLTAHNLGAQGQTTRPYESNGQVRDTPIETIVHRTDHSSSNWALARGPNLLNFEISVGVNTASRPFSAYAILNYHSGKAAGGVGAHNHTTWWLLKSYEGTVTSGTIVSPSAPEIPETTFKLNGVIGNIAERGFSNPTVAVSAKRQSGEDAGAGWYVDAFEVGSTEIACNPRFSDMSEWFRRDSISTDGANIEAARDWRFNNTNNQGQQFALALASTYHAITFDVQGTITGSAGGTVNMTVHRTDTGTQVASGSRVGNGTFTITALASDVAHFVSARESASLRGRSDNATPGGGASAFDLAVSSSGDVTAPTVAVQSPATGDPGGFSLDYNTAKITPIVIRATDAAPGLEIVEIFARFIGQSVVETVYRNGAFRGNYITNSTQTAVANGFDYSIRRDENWPGSGTVGDVTMDVDAIDGDGNRTSTTFMWKLPNSQFAETVAVVEPDDGALDHLDEAILRLPSQFRT